MGLAQMRSPSPFKFRTSACIPGLYARPGNRHKSFTNAIGSKDLWLSRIVLWGFYLSLAVLILGAAI